MRIIQLVGNDDQPVGLYKTEREDDVEEDFNLCFSTANEGNIDDENENIQENADILLEEVQIFRILADKIFTPYL